MSQMGEMGYYVKSYGPFKSEETAEFFNFISFVNPRNFNAEQDSKKNIKYYKKYPNASHPQRMISERSQFGMWWNDIFGINLTNDLILKLANESGAKGYRGFLRWLEGGAKINGRAPHHIIS